MIDARFLNRDGSLSRRKVRIAMGSRSKNRKRMTKRHSFRGDRSQTEPRARIKLQEIIQRVRKGERV